MQSYTTRKSVDTCIHQSGEKARKRLTIRVVKDSLRIIS
jgi:hypothetical protein